jgi:hypothetical protein
MKRKVQIGDLMRQQDRDIQLFRNFIGKLKGKPNTEWHIASLEHRIALAERSKAIIGHRAIMPEVRWSCYQSLLAMLSKAPLSN